MEKKVNLALVGCGYWGKNHLRVLENMGEVNLRYVCDIVKPKTGIPRKTEFTKNYGVVLGDSAVDGIVISTPTGTHYAFAKKALEAGKRIFVEKPLTTSVGEAEDLCKIVEREKGTLMVGEIFRFNPAILFLSSLIKGGEVGKLRYIESRRVGLGPIRKDVSALWDLATHDIYISNMLVGTIPDTVSYQGISHNGIFDDIVCLNLKYADRGILSTIFVNWEHPVKERKLVVGGTKKAVLFDDVEPSEKIRIYERGVDYQPSTGEFGEFQASTRDGSIIIPKIELWQPLERELEEFVRLIHTNHPGNSRQGLETVRVLEAAENSRKQNGLETRIK